MSKTDSHNFEGHLLNLKNKCVNKTNYLKFKKYVTLEYNTLLYSKQLQKRTSIVNTKLNDRFKKSSATYKLKKNSININIQLQKYYQFFSNNNYKI